MLTLQLRPDSVLPGDRITPTRGRYAGVPCEVTDVLRGRYSTYSVMVRPLVVSVSDFNVDYSEMVNVEREEES